VNYDYLSENFTNMLFARYLGRCLGINGSAFAIRREAWERLGGFDREICEDLDLASRAYDAGLCFGYAEEAEVHNKVSPSWRVWVEQRKRWGTGQAHWVKRRYRMLLRRVVEHPKMLLGALLLLFPCIPMFASSFAFPETFYVHLASLLLVFLASWKILLVSPVIAMITGVAVLKALTAVVGAVAIYSIVFYYFARRLGYPFNPIEFTVFYFVYNPLWLMISITSLLRELIRENSLKLDWKV
jgi:cellulose synthase/poly-beta-1,6-N-acetylglucosamine synthase-like glycosyltransferase